MASAIFPRIAYDRDVFALGARGDVAVGASAAIAIGSPVCRRSWLRYQPTALRSQLPRTDRSASEASRSSPSRILGVDACYNP